MPVSRVTVKCTYPVFLAFAVSGFLDAEAVAHLINHLVWTLGHSQRLVHQVEVHLHWRPRGHHYLRFVVHKLLTIMWRNW